MYMLNVTIEMSGGDQVFAAKAVEIMLSNGARFLLRELTMFPGALNVSQDDTLVIYPRDTNSVNLRNE